MKLNRIFLALLLVFSLNTSAQSVKSVVNNLFSSSKKASSTNIAEGLKEALNMGIDKQVTKLTLTDGFYKNDLVKIAFPEELQKVDRGLRRVGLGHLADEGIKALNRAAEDAVKEATPIFVDAVKTITFTDAKTILLGDDNAATTYLKGKTNTALYDKFNPVIKASFSKVGADEIWKQIISKYNSLPFISKVNPDLTDYVTTEALEGVFTMIGVEEKDIRTSLDSRTTKLLKSVFALQDGK